MINDAGNTKPDDDEDLDEFEDDDLTDTTVLSDSEGTDNVGDASVEINVERLIADFEKSDAQLSARRKEVRRRLEELAEMKALEDTFAFDFDDD
ncbi:MAG: hypothetical protein OEW59_08615 [Gammaproteobacteria bacterium]|nr:hypothetical protein [Gammaproteobacteria bacterium]